MKQKVIFVKVISKLTANGSGISDVADFMHHSRYEEPKLN